LTAYLFDTDAVSEVLKPRPSPAYLDWLRDVPPSDQFTSAVVIGELFKGAFRSPARARWLERIETDVLPALTVLPYDTEIARTYGEIRADLEEIGQLPGDADLMIAATAIRHGLVVVTGNLRHFRRVKGVVVADVLAKARVKRS
jgi:predicted nucleic acid-binding protein